MGEIWVPAGQEEDYMRHLLLVAGDPNIVTTSHGPIGVIFHAPDWAIEEFEKRLSSQAPVPEWGDGKPAVATLPAEPAEQLKSSDDEPEVPPRRRGRPAGIKTKSINAD